MAGLADYRCAKTVVSREDPLLAAVWGRAVSNWGGMEWPLAAIREHFGKKCKKRLVIFGAPPGHRMRSNCGKVAIKKLRKRSEWAGPERSRCARIAFWSARAEDFFRDYFGVLVV